MRRVSKAFTLLEMLVSITVISALCVALFLFMYSAVRQLNRAIEAERSLQLVRFIAGRMSSDISQSGGADAGSNTSELVMGNIRYEMKENKVRRTDGGDVYYLSTEGEVKAMEFHYSSKKLIKIAFTMATGGEYYLSVYARN